MIELQDVFQRFGAEYQRKHALSHSQHKAMSSICQCRSSELGGHLDVCESCGVLRVSYNSCRNRNCPKCGNLKKEQWVMDRESELLPVPYFHTVFTVPDLLNPLFRSNENQMYTILFTAASQTLMVLSLDKKYLGAQIGVTMVLHTWGQNLAFHPHVHCIVPGGGLTPSGLSFVKSRKKFFIPVKVMSKVFKGKFMAQAENHWEIDTFKQKPVHGRERCTQICCSTSDSGPFHIVWHPVWWLYMLLQLKIRNGNNLQSP